MLFSDDETLDRQKREKAKSPTYVEEQKTLKENFKKLLASDNEQSDNENDTAGFLKVKVKNVAQQVLPNLFHSSQTGNLVIQRV